MVCCVRDGGWMLGAYLGDYAVVTLGIHSVLGHQAPRRIKLCVFTGFQTSSLFFGVQL